jgi:hypothetical protein
MKSCGLLPHNPPWESIFFGTSSHIHDHHMDGKLQANDLLEMAHLELALHFFILHHVDVLKLTLRDHFIFIFKAYLILDILH